MKIPPELHAVLHAVHDAGGRPRLVGGCVRDWLLGLEAKDYDVEVGGLNLDTLHRLLAPFGATDLVGRSFGVIKLRLGEADYDFSLPRRESKIGAGHRGFRIDPEPNLDDEAAAARRDFTINAISFDPLDGGIIDPLLGEKDLRAGILRHAGPSFVDDPLRVLRAMQFAARFDFKLAPETIALCAEMADQHAELPLERIWGEWDKWAVKSVRPSRGLEVLAQTGWIRHYPEIASMRGTPQEAQWHPEGDVFVHTQHCLNALVASEGWQASQPQRRRVLSFAVLAPDFGKPQTTEYADKRGVMRWVSPGHESAGGPLAETFMQRIGAPKDLHEPVRALVVHHMLHHRENQPNYTDTQMRRLARRLIPATIEDLCEVMSADACGRPPIAPNSSLRLIAEMRTQAQALALRTQPPQPILLGRHLIARGMQAGPSFKPLLHEAFEAQLDGAFRDEPGALQWLDQRLASSPAEEAGP